MAAILIVDDDVGSSRELARSLRQMGHIVDIANSGEEALRKAKTSHPDLAIVDSMATGQLNGPETATLLKEKHEVPILYTIKSDDMAILERVGTTQPFGYITKPFKEAEVFSAIERALSLHLTELELQRRAEELEHLLDQKTTQLRETVRLAAIDETAALLGHDLRNPLQVLINLTYAVKKAFNATPSPFTNDEYKQQSLDFCAAVQKQILYLDKIVSNVLDYAQELRPVKQSIVVRDLISDALLLVSVPQNVGIHIDIGRDVEQLKGDKSLLSRALANLIQNAVQAMPDGGHVTIATKKTAQEIAISVLDTGTGIPQEDVEKVFRPLETSKAQGMGFGLAVCEKTVKGHGGCVLVESTVGEGSTFTMLIPLD
ncbi:MAG: hybrid sensor histidine kinase/response regulator [Halobacteriota archaeon]